MVTSEKPVRRGPVVFIGNSQDLDRVRTWVEGLGLLCLDEPVPEAELVVADELILDGICPGLLWRAGSQPGEDGLHALTWLCASKDCRCGEPREERA